MNYYLHGVIYANIYCYILPHMWRLKIFHKMGFGSFIERDGIDRTGWVITLRLLRLLEHLL